MPVFNKDELPKNLKSFTKVCDWCATTFYTTKPKAKYCRNTCRAYAYQKRNPERIKQDKPITKLELQQELKRVKQQSLYVEKKSDWNLIQKQLILVKGKLAVQDPKFVTIENTELLLAVLKAVTANDLIMISDYLKN